MQQYAVTKYTIYAFIVIALITFALSVNPSSLGYCTGNAAFRVIPAIFTHANIFHLAINVWCLLAIAKHHTLHPAILLLTFADTILCTIISASATPVVGLSGFIYNLVGIIAPRLRKSPPALTLIVAPLIIGFFIPGTAALLHTSCFISGIIIALLFDPDL